MRDPTLDELYEELSPTLSNTDDEERERMEKVMRQIIGYGKPTPSGLGTFVIKSEGRSYCEFCSTSAKRGERLRHDHGCWNS